MGYTKLARFSTDSESTFGTIPGTWIDQRLARETVAWDLHTDGVRIPDPTVQARLHEEPAHVRGSKFGSTLGVQLLLEGLAAADSLNSSATYSYPQAAISEILRRLMGGSNGNAGSLVVAAGSTTSVVNVTATHGARFTEGSAAGFTTSAGFEVRRIIDVTGDALTLHMQLASVPSNGSTVYNSETFFLDEDGVGGDGNSLSLRLAGQDTNDQFLCAGCCGTFTLGMALNELLTMTCNFVVANPTRTSGVTLPATYDGAGGLPVRAGQLQIGNAQTSVTTVARNILAAESFEIDPGLVVEPEPSVSGIETVNRWRMMSAATKARITTRVHVDFDTYYSDYENLQAKSIGIQIGNNPAAETGGTGVVYLHLPRAQFTRSPVRREEGGFVKYALELDAREDAATGLSTDAGVSKLYVSLL